MKCKLYPILPRRAPPRNRGQLGPRDELVLSDHVYQTKGYYTMRMFGFNKLSQSNYTLKAAVGAFWDIVVDLGLCVLMSKYSIFNNNQVWLFSILGYLDSLCPSGRLPQREQHSVLGAESESAVSCCVD